MADRLAFEVEVSGTRAITFALTAAAAKWNGVEAYRDAGFGARGQWPPGVRAFRRPEFDESPLRLVAGRHCYSEWAVPRG